jgi:hypothetical protein
MKEPAPVRLDKSPAKDRDPREAQRPIAQAGESRPVLVRYFGRMRIQRVYPLAVEMAQADGRKEGEAGSLPTVLRPIIPGALVVPAEEQMDASAQGNRVVFHVTPLARRRLTDARIEVRQTGRPVQEIALDMRVTSQRLAWLLLALAVLIPWGLIQIARAPLSGDVYDLLPARPKQEVAPPAPKAKEDAVGAAGFLNDGLLPRHATNLDPEPIPAPRLALDVSTRAAALLVVLQPGQLKDGPKDGGMPKGGPMGGMPKGGMPKGGPMGGMPMGGGMPGGGPPAQGTGGSVPEARPGSPDEVLRDRFRTWAHTSLPDMGRISKLIANDAFGRDFHLDRQRPEGVEEGRREVVYNDLASWISVLYRWTITLTEDGLALYVGLVLVALSFIAWLVHRATRAYQRESLVFAGPRADAGSETLPLGERAG